MDRFERIRRQVATVVKGYRLHVAKELPPVEFVSTGVRAIDRICSGGFPCGRVIEIYGPYSSGKTLLCQSFIAQVQRLDGVVGYVDRELAYDPGFAARTGVDNARLFYENSLKTVEDIFDWTMNTIQAIRQVDPTVLTAIIIDSIAMANTRRELGRSKKMEPDAEQDARLPWDRDQGHRAKIIGEAMRKLTGVMDRQAIVIIVNQVRSKVGVVYGNPETTPGGQSLPFVASLRLRLQQGALPRYKHKKYIYDENGMIVGTRVIVKVTKSRVGPALRVCEVVQSYDVGFLEWAGLYELLLEHGVLAVDSLRRGYFRYGSDAVKVSEFLSWIRAHPAVLDVKGSVGDDDGDGDGDDDAAA